MERVHEGTGKTVQIAITSCRIVSFATFGEEIGRNGLEIIKKGITEVEPNFPQMMFALIKSKR